MSQLSSKVKKAQTVDGGKGAMGGNHWNAHAILKDAKLPKDDIVKFMYLAEGPNLTTDIALARDVVPLHIHKVHDELIYVFEGTGLFRIDDNEYDVGPGSIIYIPQNTIHGGKLNGELRILSVYTPKFDIRNPDRIFVDERGRPIQVGN